MHPLRQSNCVVDLPKLEGISVLARIIEMETDQSLIAAAEYTLGTAASNNPTVQASALQEAGLMAALLRVRLTEPIPCYQNYNPLQLTYRVL